MADNPIAIGFRWVLQHLSPRYLSLLALLAAALLFAPSRYLAAFGLDAISLKYRPGIAIVFFCAAFLWLTHAGEYFGRPFFERWRDRRQIKACLDTLGMDEILVLQQFVTAGKNSMKFSPQNGSVERLVHGGILYRSTSIGNAFEWAYSITPLALPYLERERFQKQILKLSKKRP